MALLQTQIEKVPSREITDQPVFKLTAQNACAPNGRPLNSVLVLTWEDLVSLVQCGNAVILRESDNVKVMAKKSGTTPFREIT